MFGDSVENPFTHWLLISSPCRLTWGYTTKYDNRFIPLKRDHNIRDVEQFAQETFYDEVMYFKAFAMQMVDIIEYLTDEEHILYSTI